ncbi:50S ribosomal protein L21 [Candidatus Poribacteria bacterium]|nr:50S ribosomal protein L21 [Candidatus Poribacteria bacterium]
MHAIVTTGGKQYRVAVGEMLDVEKLDGDVGDQVTLSDVRLVSLDSGETKIGTPQVENAAVVCEIVAQDKNKKLIVFKSKRRKGYKRKLGHRQPFTRLRVEAINS